MEVMVKGLLDFGRPLASHFFKQCVCNRSFFAMAKFKYAIRDLDFRRVISGL